MALIVKKGTISHISEGTTSFARNGNMNTEHTWAFRIDNVAAKLKSASHNSLSEGDQLTVVGKMKKGTLKVYAFRNETTGAYDGGSIIISIILGLLMLSLGIPLSIFIIGLPMLVAGIALLYSAYLSYSANTLLKNS